MKFRRRHQLASTGEVIMRPRIYAPLAAARLAITMLGLLLVSGGLLPNVCAATFTVNNTVDAVDANPGNGICETAPGNGVCTLRGAIQEANATSGANTVIVPAGTYTLTIRGAAEDGAATGDLDLTNSVTITGAGAATTIVQACAIVPPATTCATDDRVFHVDPHGTGVNAVISGLTIRNGATQVISFVSSNGGGILLGVSQTLGNPVPSGRLTLIDCVMTNNSTPRDGGGIFDNAGTLTLIRTTVTGNSANNGGGIGNGDTGVVNLTNSTISFNFASLQGGGIFSGYFDISQSTKLTLTNTTVSGNTADFGGGILNNRGVLTFTNSTLSGNFAATTGGGLISSGFLNAATLNGGTITANTAGVANVGGGNAGISGAMTAMNTIIAGNTSLGTPSDCSGTITSRGHNLIQTTSGCSIVGDLTGNITGQDPHLGLLADNGGLTKTHALISGSPAIDAGNSAVPGSGGAACPLSDQRGLLRSHGSACDIGAFERVAEFSVSGITPDGDANVAPAIAYISGNGFAPGASVALRRAGQPDIIGAPVTVEAGSSGIATVFDLTGKATGAWDVIVTNADGKSVTLPAAFVVDQQALPSQLWISMSGRQTIRPGGVGKVTIFFGNLGNTDVLGVPLTLNIPKVFTGALLFRIAPPPAQVGQVPTDWSQIPIDALTSTTGYYNFNFFLPVVPAGYTGSLEFQLTPSLAQEGMSFSLAGSLGVPYFNPGLDPVVVTEFTAGAQAYAQKNLGVDISSTVLPQMNQYVTSQLQDAVQNGRDTFVGSFGTQVQVYSLGQISFDLARFGAARATGAAP